jgi:O-antigen ligase/Tfp pilus assembly protein PilF
MDLKFKICDFKAILVSLFIITLPFLYTESTLDPVLTIRFLCFSILVLILCLLSFIEKSDKRLIAHPIILALSALLIVFVLSSFFSNNVISEAIYSIFKLAVFIIFLISISDLLKDDTCRDKIFLSVSVFSLLCCLLYIHQLIGFKINNGNHRDFEKLASTMANKNLLSSALFLSIPFNIYNFKSKNKVFKSISILASFLIVFVCLFTMSKATILALSILLFSIFIIKVCSQFFSKVYYFSCIFIFIFSSFTFIHLSNSGSAISNKIKQRLIEFSNNENLFSDKRSSFATRLNLYGNTLDLIKNNPIFGIGPGNWKIQHGKFSLYGTLGEDGRKLVQRPHSDFLWIASESGIIAGIIYFMIFLIALKHIHDKIYASSENNTLFNHSIFGVILGYFFISLFDFPLERITHNFFFFLLLSYIVSTSSNKKISFFKNKINKLFWFFSLLIIGSATYVANARHKGEVYLTKAKFFKDKNTWQAIINNVDKAYIPNIYEIDRSGTPIHWYRGVANFSLGKLDDSYEDFKKAYDYNPYHLHVLNNIGTIYELKGNSKFAKQYYQKALLISPRFEEVSVNLAAILYNEQKLQESLDIILRCNIPQNHLKYDRYLKTISLKLIDNYLSKLKSNSQKRNKILALKRLFRSDYKLARMTMRGLYEARKIHKKDYIELYLLNQN